MFRLKLKELRENKGLTQYELADKLGISQAAIGNWESGTREPRIATIGKIAKFFDVPTSYLFDDSKISILNNDIFQFENIHPVQLQRVPMLGKIACGTPIYADEDRESYVLAGTDVKADFCLTAKGDSMIGARIMDGDIVFCRAQEMVENGEIGVVIIGDEATLKRVYLYPDKKKLVLQAENPKYEPFVYIGEELQDIRIIGKAIAFQSDIK